MFMIIRSAFMFETLEHLNFGFVSNFDQFYKIRRISSFYHCLSFNFYHTYDRVFAG
jgi:hypothetical protein